MNRFLEKRWLFTILSLYSIVFGYAQDINFFDSDLFKLTEKGNNSHFSLGISYEKNDTLDLGFLDMTISGLSVDMDVTAIYDDFLVRLIMEDTNGKKYLVAECSPIITASKKMKIVDYCEETASLWNEKPKEMRIYVYGATVKIHTLNYSTSARFSDEAEWQKSYGQLREAQTVFKSNIINDRNKARQELWYAGVTSLSKMPFSERMRIIGGSESAVTDGVEYYIGGIFHIIDHHFFDNNDNMQVVSMPRDSCVEEFSWRNRHGKDWLTPVKDQGDSGYCVAFSAISCLEALTNLYFNRKIDLDLSEQEAAICSGNTNPWHGMHIDRPLPYLKNHGVCDEIAYPFVNDSIAGEQCLSETINPSETVKINSYIFTNKNEEIIKKALIKYGPLHTGYSVQDYSISFIKSHAMALYGYSVIHKGDTIHWLEQYGNQGSHGMNPPLVIESDSSEFIGRTLWKFKNSYINGGADNPQYMYIVFDNIEHMVGPIILKTPITTMNYSEDDIVCEDADGDGFYYWGIGSRPSSCPSWVPIEPDGNDADPNVGPMDDYGYTINVNPNDSIVIHIDTDTSTSSETSYVNNHIVENGATWTICHNSTFHYGAWIRVKQGSTLVIDGCTLSFANLILEAGSTLIIKNEGLLVSPTSAKFIASVGAVVNIISGTIF